ncbi:hypothetical protein [Lysobacter antibioticus]|uniref:hypothetical protein n=1 Tax=Lysobacter TaxID=68 RepID=UPI0012699DF9|nr:hypothetical protein [Lysobacter antibioticus]
MSEAISRTSSAMRGVRENAIAEGRDERPAGVDRVDAASVDVRDMIVEAAMTAVTIFGCAASMKQVRGEADGGSDVDCEAAGSIRNRVGCVPGRSAIADSGRKTAFGRYRRYPRLKNRATPSTRTSRRLRD